MPSDTTQRVTPDDSTRSRDVSTPMPETKTAPLASSKPSSTSSQPSSRVDLSKDAPNPSGKPTKFTLRERFEAWVSRLSAKSNFWNRVCSLFFLPYAFKSGIKMKRLDTQTFTAVLPFRRFNKNFYNAMAGAALLGNSEIAGGMYIFGECGSDYAVVCKEMRYRFLRPCFGPAVYRIKPREELKDLMATGDEFNLTMDINVMQQIKKPNSKDKRVGRVEITFHVTPKVMIKQKQQRNKEQLARAAKQAAELPAPEST